MIPVPSLAGTGSIDAELGMEIVTKVLTSFFDKHLKELSYADPETVSQQYDLLHVITSYSIHYTKLYEGMR